MKTMRCWNSLAVSAWFALVSQVLAGPDGIMKPRAQQWAQVKEAVGKGLPKTAKEQLEKIAAQARGEAAYPEAIRAAMWAMSLEAQIEGGQPIEVIQRLQAAIPQWPEEARPVMETILARWYWAFFQANRWRFAERTRVEGAAGDDPLTWDLPRILEEIDRHFAAALKAAEQLRKIPIADWDGLIQPGTVPDEYRPTLYDFLAREALEFYQAGEQAGSKAEGAFELDADSPVFGTRDEFLAWKLDAGAAQEPLAKAILLFQDLLRFHGAAGQDRARMDADLGRLLFAKNHAAGEDKNERYRKALARFVAENGNDPISARARSLWAGELKGEGDLAEAHRVAIVGGQAFPDSPGGAACFNLVQEIEAPTLGLHVERVWNKPWPEVRVDYRNLTQVHFRVVKFEFDRLKRGAGWNLEELEREEVRKLAQAPPLREWGRELAATADFQARTERVEVPADLEPGLYVLLASQQADFRKERENQVSQALFWVSDLALVIRSESGSGELGGFVLNAVSGEPLAGASVEAIARREQGNRTVWEALSTLKTDQLGWFSFRPQNRGPVTFLASYQGQQVSSMQGFGADEWRNSPGSNLRTLFFTDRSIYRPGQTIQYKGLSVRMDRVKNGYRAEAKHEVEVIFADGNGQEIQRRKHRCNDYGSFSGSFQAPRDRVLGRMSIRVDGEGEAGVQVEEYKRPKFKVALEAPQGAVRLGGEIDVGGAATGYTGAPVDGAEVKYRVVRETRYPIWWRWWEPRGGESQEIAHGKTRTGVDGRFSVRFTARPERGATAESDPKFRFTVYADVTDSAGETRSDERAVNLGFTAMEAALAAPEWQEAGKPVKLAISTRSLDGEGREAKGTVDVFRLKEPEQVTRVALDGAQGREGSNPESWEPGERVAGGEFQTAKNGTGEQSYELPVGSYRAILKTDDGLGKAVAARLTIRVLDPAANRLSSREPFLLTAPAWTAEPGTEFAGLWGTGYASGRAFVEVIHRGKPLLRTWTEPGRTQQRIRQAVDESMRGGFHLLVTMVRENRAYTVQRKIDVPWSNKQLAVRWERHRSKLEPGAKETWTAVVTGPGSERVVAEVVAGLYDASLDAFLPHAWARGIDGFYEDYCHVMLQLQNRENALQWMAGSWQREHKNVDLSERRFPPEVVQLGGGRRRMLGKAMMMEGGVPDAVPMMMAPAPAAAMAEGGVARDALKAKEGGVPDKPVAPPAPKPNLDAAPLRRNLDETAFFFPHLVSGKNGEVRLEFTMPEALTAWHFQAFAHDRKLRSGFLEDQVVSAKDLMVQPNPPRFLREGDELEFPVKVLNRSDKPQQGTVRLTFQDARTLNPADAALGNGTPEQAFAIPAGESRSFSWRIQIPDGEGVLTYKAVAASATVSDGEEGFVPVLPRRILVTESAALPILGAGEKDFRLENLIRSGASDTLRHQSVTVQMVSNPAWYAVMSLPYLMEFPHECSEQVFSRYYANSLAEHVALSDPKIRRVFDLWKGTKTLESPLEKNPELKSILLEETPWVREARRETEARRQVGILFDGNRLHQEQSAALQKLRDQQLDSGAWPWFAGGSPSEYITLHVVTGFGRLRHMGVAEVDTSLALQALSWLDAELTERHRRILQDKTEKENHLAPDVALYLYGRSFFLDDQPIADENRAAVDYFLAQARDHWLTLDSRMSKGHLALALKRFQVHPEVPPAILASLKEFSVTDPEFGRYWKDGGPAYWWRHAPVEAQALMIEAFDEVAGDAAFVEELKVWLLKQKQTQQWQTTKATADAVYGLLRRGANGLASDALVEVQLGGVPVVPEAVEAGTGFFEQRFPANLVRPKLGEVHLKKSDAGVAWGSLHWQYLESLEKVPPQKDNPLRISKSLFRKETTAAGLALRKIGPGDELAVGDLLVVRLEIRADRDMEFLHLKDQRGSGLEPVNVLSGYRYQGGLGYFESTRDTATHFFLERLPAGAYVLESESRVAHRGAYQSGLAELQCMYAPEFMTHSESFALKVR